MTHVVIHVLMTLDCLPLQEVEAVHDGMVIGVAFFDVGMAGCKVSGDEAEVCVVVIEPNGNCAFVP